MAKRKYQSGQKFEGRCETLAVTSGAPLHVSSLNDQHSKLRLTLFRAVDKVPCTRMENAFVGVKHAFTGDEIKPCLHTGWLATLENGEMVMISVNWLDNMEEYTSICEHCKQTVKVK